MKMILPAMFVAALAAFSLIQAADPLRQDREPAINEGERLRPQPRPGEQTEEKPFKIEEPTLRDGAITAVEVDATAKVVKVDKAERTVIIKAPAGQETKIEVPADVPNFDQVKKGTPVQIRYLQAVALAVAKPGQPLGETSESVRLVPKGGEPSEVIVETKRAAGMVTDVDSAKREVALQLPDGKRRTLTVSEEIDLSTIRIGDKVVLRYTEAVALEISKPRPA